MSEPVEEPKPDLEHDPQVLAWEVDKPVPRGWNEENCWCWWEGAD